MIWIWYPSCWPGIPQEPVCPQAKLFCTAIPGAFGVQLLLAPPPPPPPPPLGFPFPRAAGTRPRAMIATATAVKTLGILGAFRLNVDLLGIAQVSSPAP